MNQIRGGLTELWKVALDERLSSSGTSSIRAFLLDVNGDGKVELCFQKGTHFLALNGGRIVDQGEKLVLPLPGESGESDAFIETEGSLVRKVVGGEPAWERNLARRRFGVGLGRDGYDDLEWDSDFLGFHRENVAACHLDYGSFTGDGSGEIAALTTGGRLVFIGEEGEVNSVMSLPKGSIEEAAIFPVEDEKDGLMFLASIDYRQIRKLFFWYESREKVTFLCGGGRILDRRNESFVLGPVKGGGRKYLNADLGPLSVVGRSFSGGKGMGPELFFNTRENDKKFLPDPWNRERGLIVRTEPSQGRFVVQTTAGDDLWEQELPASGNGSWQIEGTLGPEGEPGGELLALWFRTEHTLAEVKAEVRQHHLRVFRMDGSLVAGHDFPQTGESGYGDERLPLLADVDGDGRLELLVLASDSVTAHAIEESAGTIHQTPAQAEIFAAMPEFPLPEEDLWSRDLVGEAERAAGEKKESDEEKHDE